MATKQRQKWPLLGQKSKMQKNMIKMILQDIAVVLGSKIKNAKTRRKIILQTIELPVQKTAEKTQIIREMRQFWKSAILQRL